jgi:transposase
MHLARLESPLFSCPPCQHPAQRTPSGGISALTVCRTAPNPTGRLGHVRRCWAPQGRPMLERSWRSRTQHLLYRGPLRVNRYTGYPTASPAMSPMPKAEVNSEHWRLRYRPTRLDGVGRDMIQAPKPEPPTMRYELSDNERTAIKPMLPNKSRGVRRVNDRRVLNGIFWVLRSGAPWRDLPETYGPRTTCYNRFVRWRQAGVWDRIMDALATGHDGAVQMIDTSVVRVHQHGACIADNYHQDMAMFGSSQRVASQSDVARGSRLRRRLDQGAGSPARSMGEHSAETKSQRPDLLQPVSLSAHATWSNGSSTRSSNVGVSRPDTTNSLPTIWRSSNSHQSVFGCALMSPRPRCLYLGEGCVVVDAAMAALSFR